MWSQACWEGSYDSGVLGETPRHTVSIPLTSIFRENDLLLAELIERNPAPNTFQMILTHPLTLLCLLPRVSLLGSKPQMYYSAATCLSTDLCCFETYSLGYGLYGRIVPYGSESCRLSIVHGRAGHVLPLLLVDTDHCMMEIGCFTCIVYVYVQQHTSSSCYHSACAQWYYMDPMMLKNKSLWPSDAE